MLSAKENNGDTGGMFFNHAATEENVYDRLSPKNQNSSQNSTNNFMAKNMKKGYNKNRGNPSSDEHSISNINQNNFRQQLPSFGQMNK